MTKENQLKEFLQRFQPSQEEQPVYEFVKSHPHSSVHECAKSLSLTEVVTLRFFNRLVEKGRLKLTVLRLDVDCKNSCYYSAC